MTVSTSLVQPQLVHRANSFLIKDITPARRANRAPSTPTRPPPLVSSAQSRRTRAAAKVRAQSVPQADSARCKGSLRVKLARPAHKATSQTRLHLPRASRAASARSDRAAHSHLARPASKAASPTIRLQLPAQLAMQASPQQATLPPALPASRVHSPTNPAHGCAKIAHLATPLTPSQRLPARSAWPDPSPTRARRRALHALLVAISRGPASRLVGSVSPAELPTSRAQLRPPSARIAKRATSLCWALQSARRANLAPSPRNRALVAVSIALQARRLSARLRPRRPPAKTACLVSLRTPARRTAQVRAADQGCVLTQ